MINLFCCCPDLSKLQNIAISRDDVFPEIDFLAFRKALKVLSTVLARKERCWTLNCKARAFCTGCRKLHAFPCQRFRQVRKAKKAMMRYSSFAF